jgi:hypothetical protein
MILAFAVTVIDPMVFTFTMRVERDFSGLHIGVPPTVAEIVSQ